MDGAPLTLRFHKLVEKDVRSAMRYYEREAGSHLAEDFYRKLMDTARAVTLHPHRFHFGSKGLRRANLKRFPYHVLFKDYPGKILVVVVRHHERHPRFGLNRLPS